MLYEIGFKNFAGIVGDMEISLVAAKAQKKIKAYAGKDDFVLSGQHKSDISALSFLSIHGDNASGKNTFMNAVGLAAYVLSGDCRGYYLRTLLNDNVPGQIHLSFKGDDGNIYEYNMDMLAKSEDDFIEITQTSYQILKKSANKVVHVSDTKFYHIDKIEISSTEPYKEAIMSLMKKFECINMHDNFELTLDDIQAAKNDTGLFSSISLERDKLLKSRGGINFIYLYDSISKAAKDGKILFVNGLDSDIHPRRVFNLIEKFAADNKQKAQIVCTMTSSSIMNHIRPDQIYLMDTLQGADGNIKHSILSIADFDTRGRTDIEKMYLDGRFGGVPSYLW